MSVYVYLQHFVTVEKAIYIIFDNGNGSLRLQILVTNPMIGAYFSAYRFGGCVSDNVTYTLTQVLKG